MLYNSIVVASAFVAFANAQSTAVASTTVSQAMPAIATQGFNIGLINSTVKFTWCTAQHNTCVDMCLGHTSSNMCDDTSLVYQCICYNGTEPDSTSFIQTIPYYECQATFAQCINNNPNDEQAQSTCTADEQCPTRNATAERYPNGVSGSSSSSSTATATSSGSQSSSASASGSSSTASHAAGATVTPASTGAFVALLFAVCRLVL